MGHRKHNAPKRGSLAYIPRVRARSLRAKVRFWPEAEGKPHLMGFAGYKAGMTHAFIVEDRPTSPHQGKEVFAAVTVLDTPPLLAYGIRFYRLTEEGLRPLGEAWTKDPPKDLGRALTLPKEYDAEASMKRLEESLSQASELRLLCVTQPRLSSTGKKKPDLFEVKVGGGTLQEQFEYAKTLLGKAISVSDVFKEGAFVDIAAISKGKGFQGPMKRWGVKRLSHKSRKKVRGVGTLGPWTPPRVMYTVPRAGQTGLFQRTEYNKRIIAIGERGEEVTPKGGFLRYGLVKGQYVLLAGSIPGPAKRLVELREPARQPLVEKTSAPRVTFIKR
ncbi:MAG: 50S ribosomal protein L3 [Candidatus Bathyarchaeia archaeon]